MRIVCEITQAQCIIYANTLIVRTSESFLQCIIAIAYRCVRQGVRRWSSPSIVAYIYIYIYIYIYSYSRRSVGALDSFSVALEGANVELEGARGRYRGARGRKCGARGR